MAAAAHLKVVLAEDEPVLRQLFSALLKAAGLNVVAEVENGAGAVEAFKAETPDITLLDLNMPGVNGMEALAHIRSENGDAVVIMLTAQSDNETLQLCIDAGAAGYIQKDIPATVLASEVIKIFEHTLNADTVT